MTKHILIVLAFSLFANYAGAQQAAKVHGVSLFTWAKRVGEDRYESPRSWDKTYDVFYDRYKRSKKVKIHDTVNLPSVRFAHFESLDPKTPWMGINVYEYRGKVRVYVIKRRTKASPAPTKN